MLVWPYTPSFASKTPSHKEEPQLLPGYSRSFMFHSVSATSIFPPLSSVRPMAPRAQPALFARALNETALMPLSASPQVQLECQHLRVPSWNLPSFSQTVLIAPTSALTHHFIIALRTALLFRRRDLFICLINSPIPSGWCRAWYVARFMTGLMSEWRK